MHAARLQLPMTLAKIARESKNTKINQEMRGEPSRDLLDASQAVFASPPRLAGSSQRQDELGSQAAKYSAARQPCTRQAPRGHHSKRKGSPAQLRRCRRPGRRAPSRAAPTPPGARRARSHQIAGQSLRARMRRPSERASDRRLAARVWGLAQNLDLCARRRLCVPTLCHGGGETSTIAFG